MIPSIMYSFGISLNYTGVWANLAFCVDDKSMVFLYIQKIYTYMLIYIYEYS